MPGSSTVWGGSDREVTPWESARTSRTVPPGGRAPEGALAPGGCCTTPGRYSAWSTGASAFSGAAAVGLPVGGSERVSFFFFFLPPHIPPALLAGARVPVGARGPLLGFRKNILYGVFKKSAHRHTNHLPVCTFSGTWPFCPFRSPRPQFVLLRTRTQAQFTLLRTRTSTAHNSPCSGLAPIFRPASDT